MSPYYAEIWNYYQFSICIHIPPSVRNKNDHSHVHQAAAKVIKFFQSKESWIRHLLLFFNLFSWPTISTICSFGVSIEIGPQKSSALNHLEIIELRLTKFNIFALKVFWVNSVTITVLFKAYIQAEGCKVYHFQLMRFIVTGWGRNNGTKYSTWPRYWCPDCLGTTTRIRKTMIQLNHLHTALTSVARWHSLTQVKNSLYLVACLRRRPRHENIVKLLIWVHISPVARSRNEHSNGLQNYLTFSSSKKPLFSVTLLKLGSLQVSSGQFAQFVFHGKSGQGKVQSEMVLQIADNYPLLV